MNTVQPVWVASVGIELTFVPKDWDIPNDTPGWSVREDYYQEMRGLLKKRKTPAYTCHLDSWAVEVPTKILTSMDEAKQAYGKIRRVANKVGMTPQNPYIGGGGGHIHINIIDRQAKIKIIRDCANRPYLNWLFNEPCDNSNARNYAGQVVRNDFLCKKYKFLKKNGASDGYSWDDAVGLLWSEKYESSYLPHLGKSTAVNTSDGHLEFRFFDAAKDWKQQEEHLMFAQHWVKWVLDNPMPECESPLYWRKPSLVARKWTRNRVEKKFRKLIEEIGLDWNRYKKYMKNYDERVSVYGIGYLV